MLLTINQEQYSDYLQKFKDAVRSLFPILCFTPDETEAFIKAFAPQWDGKSCVRPSRPIFKNFPIKRTN